MTLFVSQTEGPNFGGFQAVKSQRKVQFGQKKRYQTKDLMEYYHNKLYGKLSKALLKSYNPKSSKNGNFTFKLLLVFRYPDTSGLHLNKAGIAHLVTCIKNSLFQGRHIGSRIHNERTFADTLGTGPLGPGTT